MLEINLKSPPIIIFDTKKYLCTKISHKNFTYVNLGVKIPVSLSVFLKLKCEVINDNKITDDIKSKLIEIANQLRSEILNDQTIIQNIFEIQNIVSQCSRLAELLFINLKTINRLFADSGRYSKIFPKPIEDLGLDFMKHRDKFSEVLQQKIKDGELTNINRKSITGSFNSFIKDRNKYTHGEVLYWYPDCKTLIEYEDENKKITYGELNKEILNSFIECYNKLNQFISDLIEEENL